MNEPRHSLQSPASEMFARLTGRLEHDLVAEIQELRNEIAALRSDLLPVPSLIVTGRQALDEFKRLSGGAR